MSKQLRLDVAQLTDVGRKRPHNEDNMAYVIPKDAQAMVRKGALFIVADGMGGHAAGEVASEIAVDTVSKVYYQDDSDDITVSLLHAIKRANALIHQRAAENMLRSGMGTTCVAAVMRGGMAYIANVGDSRAYLVRGGQVKQVSQDHSWVEEQVRAGLLTRDQARSHAQRNVITRCLGTQADVEVDVFTEQLEEGDSLVLCSDGLSGLVGDDELLAIVDKYVPQESVYHLVERANENGGPDNITAIVIRVQEVGWDPPGALRPVRVGGREADETTAVLGTLQGPLINMPARIEDNHAAAPGSPLRISSGPLLSPDGFAAAPRAAVAPSRQTQNRLFYPTVVLLVLLIVMIVGGGTYYFLRHGLFGQSVDVDSTLKQASFLIEQAKTEVTSNPGLALKKLSDAQKDLRAVQNASLSSSQQATFNTLLQNDFTSTVKNAITDYNQQAGITALPCSNTTTMATVNSGSTNTQAASIAVVQDEKGQNVSYVRGEDYSIYQIDSNHSLVNKLALPGNSQVRMMAADTQNQRVLALTMQPPKGTTPASYGVSLLSAQASGALKDVNDATIDQTFTKNGQEPVMLTAWGDDVYVVLASNTSQDNTATILDIPINADKLQGPHALTISITTALVSMTAFPNHQLFLVYKDGSIQSLQLGSGSQTPVSVVVQNPIPAPLATTPRDFTASVTVPLPPDQPASLSSFLAVTGATTLLSGTVDKVPHLYIVDGMYHRIIDLRVVAAPAAGTPTATPAAPKATTNAAGGGVAAGTPASTPATPKATTNAAGGGVASAAGTPVTMEVVQQYASANVLSFVMGAAIDPKVPVLYLLTKLGPTATTVSQVNIDVSQKTACQP